MRKSVSSLIGLSFVLLATVCLVGCNKSLTEASQKYPSMTVSTVDLKPTSTSVTLSQAKAMALAFLQSKHKNKTVTIESSETITKNGIPYLHVFNAADNDGFVIMSSDSIYKPILAFDSSRKFDMSSINPGLGMWLNKHGHELEFMRNNHSAFRDSIAKQNKTIWKSFAYGLNKLNQQQNAGENIRKVATSSGGGHTDGIYYPPQVIGSGADMWTENVGPLLTTEWHQNDPFNQFTPSSSNPSYNYHCPVGCVPVAMGQVMYYLETQSPSSTPAYNYSIMVPKIVNGVPSTYPINNPTGYAETATLLSDIGNVMVYDLYSSLIYRFADYQSTYTAANNYFCDYVFNHFGYYSSRTVSYSDQILGGSKDGLVYAPDIIAEIRNNRPCMLGGFPGKTNYGLFYIWSGDGHEWVCDGVNQTFLHSFDIVEYYDQWGNPTTTENQYYGPAYSVLDYLHMNWGWGSIYGGSANYGWFDCSVSYTSSPATAANPAGVDYQYFQTVIYNIHK